jgi:hypothetical protein
MQSGMMKRCEFYVRKRSNNDSHNDSHNDNDKRQRQRQQQQDLQQWRVQYEHYVLLQ